MAEEKNYITPAGFRALQTEFEQLRNHTRREVVTRLAEAAAEGDRSENAEYIYRKKQLREIDRRIRFLAKRMSIAEVIDPSEQRTDRVRFGCLVTVEDEDGKTQRYQIVGVDETEPKNGRISWNSPIGKALVGKGLDDTATVRWHAGERELSIVKIEAPPRSREAAPLLRPADLGDALKLTADAEDADEGEEDDTAPA